MFYKQMLINESKLKISIAGKMLDDTISVSYGKLLCTETQPKHSIFISSSGLTP